MTIVYINKHWHIQRLFKLCEYAFLCKTTRQLTIGSLLSWFQQHSKSICTRLHVENNCSYFTDASCSNLFGTSGFSSRSGIHMARKWNCISISFWWANHWPTQQSPQLCICRYVELPRPRYLATICSLFVLLRGDRPSTDQKYALVTDPNTETWC